MIYNTHGPERAALPVDDDDSPLASDDDCRRSDVLVDDGNGGDDTTRADRPAAGTLPGRPAVRKHSPPRESVCSRVSVSSAETFSNEI